MTYRSLLRRTIEISHFYNHHHLPGTLSALQVMAPIFARLQSEDVFVLSKGHAAVALYACLESQGLKPDLTRSHPERCPEQGITCTTGSLGHGLPMAVGIALAKKLHGEAGCVYVLMGDGECAEGTTWESLNLAHYFALENLEAHVDGNQAGALGDLPYDVTANLVAAFPQYVRYHRTNKGAGVPLLEGSKDHKRVLSDQEYKTIMQQMNEA